MKNQTYFTLENPRGSMRQFKKADNYLEQRVKHDTGYFDGNARSIPAIVMNGATENDLWYVVNLRDAVSNVFLQAIAVLGALDADQAIYAALQTFGDEYNHPTNDSVTVSDASYFALKRFLDIKQPFHGEITQAALNECQAQVLKQPATWSDDNITSHNGSMAALMHDMVQSDVNGELLDPVSKYDAVDMFIGDDGVIGTYDALITSYQRLDLLQERLATAMGKAAKGDDITLTGVTRSKPFKRNGVVNVAVIYELSDGQTISVIFHNPDSTPTKLSAQDTLTSWKWLLNKRDVSIVLQPKNGENVQLNQLAIRMLKLAHQNSARFKRTIAKRLENEKTLADMVANQAELEKTEAALDAEIIDLQKQIDEKTKAVDLDLNGKVKPSKSKAAQEPIIEVEVADLAGYGEVNITDIGEENIYFAKDGKKYFSKVVDTEIYQVGNFNFAESVTLPSEALQPQDDEPDQNLINLGEGYVYEVTPDPDGGNGANFDFTSPVDLVGVGVFDSNKDKGAARMIELKEVHKNSHYLAKRWTGKKGTVIDVKLGAAGNSGEGSENYDITYDNGYKYRVEGNKFDGWISDDIRDLDPEYQKAEQEKRDLRQKNHEEKLKREAEAKAKEDALVDQVNEWLATTTYSKMQKGKIITDLKKEISYSGTIVGVMSRMEFVQRAVANGGVADSFEEPALKRPTRTRWNNMDQREQDDFELRYKAAGNKTVLTVAGYGVTKAEYEYAQYLSGKKAVVEPEVIEPELTPEPAIEPVTGDEMADIEPVVDADTEYLQSIINGTADLANAGDDLERIGENLNPELEDLFEQAAEAYAQYAIAQAATI